MDNLGDYNLIGQPCNRRYYRTSGAGGDQTLFMEPDPGEIWIVKMLTAWHDGAAAVPVQWSLRDQVNSLDIMGPYSAAVLQNVQYPWPFATDTAGPLVLVPSSVRVLAKFVGTAPNENLYIYAHVHIIKGVAIHV
jgi:hypothetical protein